MIPNSTWQRYVYSIASGILLCISFPFSGSLTALVFVSWVPLFLVAISLLKTQKSSPHFFIHSYVSVFLFNLGSTWWIWNSTGGGAAMAFICNSLLMASFLTLAYRLFKKTNAALLLIALSTFWICFEFIHLNWELSWPWLTMGNFFSIRTSWIQWYEYTGILGGSFWVMIANLLFTLLLISREKKWLLGISNIVILTIPLFASQIIINKYAPKPVNLHSNATGTRHLSINVLLLQPNIDPYTEKFGGLSAEVQLQKMILLAQTQLREAPTLIVGPETALQESFITNEFKHSQSFSLLKKAFVDQGHTVLMGASTFELFAKKRSSASKPLPKNGYYESYNSSLFFSPKKIQFIHKSKLVLGVEKIPFSTLFPFLEKWSINNGGTSGSLGIETEAKVFREGDLIIAPIICYESIYGDFVRHQAQKGANLLCIITNDGWWGNSPGHKQHNSFAALRAIENRKYVIRSGNTGISSIFNHRGICITETQYDKLATIKKQVPLLQYETFYSLHGDYLGWAALFFLVYILSYKLWTVFKNK